MFRFLGIFETAKKRVAGFFGGMQPAAFSFRPRVFFFALKMVNYPSDFAVGILYGRGLDPNLYSRIPSKKTNMVPMEIGPCEDVFPIENGGYSSQLC